MLQSFVVSLGFVSFDSSELLVGWAVSLCSLLFPLGFMCRAILGLCCLGFSVFSMVVFR